MHEKNLRLYGRAPFKVAVIHGGPGAPGEMAPVARRLALERGVLEPLQTAASLNGQVRELHTALKEHAEPPAILIGWSWGAMLSLIFTARYPSLVSKLIIIGGVPCEEEYAASIMDTRLKRLDDSERSEVLTLMKTLDNPAVKDKNALMKRLGHLMEKADTYDPLPSEDDPVECQYDIYRKVWRQAARLRKSGAFLEAVKKISCPVIALHGDYDPHPYQGVQAPLARILTDFRFILLERCGHHPWRERAASERFYGILRDEVRR